MFGARCHSAWKPLMKEFLVDDHDGDRQQHLRQAHRDVVAVKERGSGQPHIMWPIEKYISTSRKPSDQSSRRLQLRRFVIGQRVSARRAGAAVPRP